jgi:hypothetical protein
MERDLIMLAQQGGPIDVIDAGQQLTSDITGLLRAVAILAFVATVGFTYWKSGRAWIPTVIAGVVGGIMLWMIYSPTVIRDSFDRTIRRAGQVDVHTLVAADAPQQPVQRDAGLDVVRA